MIKLLNRTTGHFHTFEITVFPDKTSQVWKVNPVPSDRDDLEVIWMFENEGEFVQLLQLGQLLKKMVARMPVLYAPYLPWGRQDKDVENNLSFAGKTILFHLINSGGFREIKSYDTHSNVHPVKYIPPTEFHNKVLEVYEYDLICYPDKGAAVRYHSTLGNRVPKCVSLTKERDQETGEITGLSVNGYVSDIEGSDILIVDDIADGSMTFIKTAELLYKLGAARADLCVSHGLFSKGTDIVYSAGIKTIYTTNSLLKNQKHCESPHFSITEVC